MKHLKKRHMKRTVEAYACECTPCGSPMDCANLCAGDIVKMNNSASTYAEGTVSVFVPVAN